MIVHLGGRPYTVERVVEPGETVLTATPVQRPATAARLVVVGDSYTDAEWTGPAGWPVLVADRFGLELLNLAEHGAGYVRVNPANPSTFVAQVAAGVPADATAVVVWGGYNDRLIGLAGSLEQRWAARATVAAVRRLAPGAVLLLLGPQWPATPPAVDAYAARDAVAGAAAEVGVTAVDTLGWFAGRPELIGPDGLHPDAGPAQQHLAGLVGGLLAAAMSAAAGGAMLAVDAA